MDTAAQQKRNRIIALSFVSVLLLLIYGPLAQWFTAADRLIYDQLAGGMPNQASENTYIASIDGSRLSPSELLDNYGKLIQTLQNSGVRRIILANPPEISAADELPAWTSLIDSQTSFYVPTRHRLSDISRTNGIVAVQPDSDNVLRKSMLWHFNNGVKSPSLPLAISFDSSETGPGAILSAADEYVYLSSYVELPRVDVARLLQNRQEVSLQDATVFVDSDLPFVGATAVLPSGQFVTVSEVMATLLADLENDRTIATPTSIKALEYLIPAMLAIVAVLFPTRPKSA